MTRIRVAMAALTVLSAIALNGCVSITVGTDGEPPEFTMKDWGNAFATAGSVPKFDGHILAAHLFRGGKYTGEIAAIDIWPIVGLNVGVLGLKARLFNLEAGAATLFYHPGPETEWGADAEATAGK